MDDIRKPDVVTVAVSRIDGGLTVIRIVENEYGPNPENTNERMLYKHYDITNEYVEALLQKHIDGGNWKDGLLPISWRFVPNDFVDENTDRSYRNAWKDSGKNKPDHDMDKAKNIHKEKLRALRQPLLDQLDIEYMKADEEGDQQKKKDIAKEKQRLRDITKLPEIDNAQTIEELKRITL